MRLPIYVAGPCISYRGSNGGCGCSAKIGTMKKFVHIACTLYVVSGILFAFKVSGPSVLLFAVGIFAWFVSILFGFGHVLVTWAKERWRTLIPILICILIFVPPRHVGAWIRDAYFRSIISQLTAEAKEAAQQGNSLHPNHGFRAIQIDSTDFNGTVTMYSWGGGFPAQTYLVRSDIDSTVAYFAERSWIVAYQLKDNWWVTVEMW